MTQKPSPWPLIGYAPWQVLARTCSTCGNSHNSDKHSWHCLPCAVRAANAEMERLRGERTLAAMSPGKRAGIMREIAAAVDQHAGEDKLISLRMSDGESLHIKQSRLHTDEVQTSKGTRCEACLTGL